MSSFTRNSLRYWLPEVRRLHIPHPRTVIVPIGGWWMAMLDGKAPPERAAARLLRVADRMGYPVFLRTDYMSGKHQYDHACHLSHRKDLFRNLYGLFEAHGMAFMAEDPTAICFRRWLNLDARWTAFDGLPIAREWRIFADSGAFVCQHGYWPEDALSEKRPPPEGWASYLGSLYREPPPRETMEWALRLTRELSGAWSIDVACDTEGRYWLIDMAEAERSWHPEHPDALRGSDADLLQ